MGPGRFFGDFLARCYVEGVHFFPSLPNGTEILQELDQLFAAVKNGCYRNRDILTAAKIRAEGADAKLDITDVGYCICRGTVPVKKQKR